MNVTAYLRVAEAAWQLARIQQMIRDQMEVSNDDWRRAFFALARASETTSRMP